MHKVCCEWKLRNQQKEVNPQIILVKRSGCIRQKEQVDSTMYGGEGKTRMYVFALLKFMGPGAEKAPWISPVLCFNGNTKRQLHGRL